MEIPFWIQKYRKNSLVSLYAIYYYTICMIGHKAILFVPIKPCRRSTDEEDFDD